MRIVPILMAVLAMILIFLFVFERDQIARAIGRPEAPPPEAAPPDSAQVPEAAPGAVRVIAMHSTARPIDTAVALRGQTEADRQVEMRAETSGQVVSEPLRKGRFVTAGQLLCALDPANRKADLAEAQARLREAQARVPEAQARVTEAEARLEEALINDNAAQKLSQGGFASDTRVAATRAAVSSARAVLQAAESGLESTRAGIQSAHARVEAAQKEIDRLRITAPFDGLLESDTAELGSLLQPGLPCGTVIRLDPIVLVGFVPETDVGRIATGATASARLIDGGSVSGVVTFLSRSADPETRTFRVEIDVPNPDLRLRDGQTVDIRIAADGTKAHLVPQSALTLDDAGTLGVRVVDAGSRAQFVPVALLRDTEQGMWLGGLPERADIITIGQEYVIDGVPVAPRFPDPVR